jgi:hypothetical protein
VWSGVWRRICWRQRPHTRGGPATRSEVEEQRCFLHATLIGRVARRSTIGPAVALIARCWPGIVLSYLWGSEVGRSCTLMRRFRAWRVCCTDRALSVRPSVSCDRRDKARAHSERCFCESVDVRVLTAVPSMIVALRPRSCWGRSRSILPLWLWLGLQSIAKDIVCRRLVVIGRLEGAQLWDGRRQRLNMEGWRSWGAARPHITLRALEVAIVARLRIHVRGGSGRARRLGGGVGRLRARRRRGEAVPAGTSRACDLCRGHWRLWVRRGILERE